MKYALSILAKIITLLIIAGMYSKASGSFEVIVISALIIIYVTLLGSHMTSSMLQTQYGVAIYHEFIRLRKILNDRPTDEELEKLNQANQQLNKSGASFLINGIFNALLYVIAVIGIITALN